MNIVTDNLDQIIDAPDGIKRLRELILQLAVQGKLVEQLPNEGTAAELLKQIKEAKRKDAEERKARGERIRKTKALPPVNEDEISYVVPESWIWARLGELGELGRGKSKHRPRNDPSLYSGGIYPMVQTGDVARAIDIIQTHTALYNKKGVEQSKLWPKGTLCITIAANIGDTGILGVDACFPDSVVGFVPAKPMDTTRFFQNVMRTRQQYLEDQAPATAQKNINLAILEVIPVALPPLLEQKRIVAKVDELMAWCDELEALKEKRDALQKAALKATLNSWSAQARLRFKTSEATAVEEPAARSDDILKRRLAAALQMITDTADVKQLRDAILQLAVQGRLVPQRKSDGTAADLLKQIETAKAADLERRKANGERIRKTKSLPPISDDEIPFDIPENWEWVRLDEICTYIQRGKSPKYSEIEEVPVIAQKCVQWHGFELFKAKFINPATLPSYAEERFIQDGDLLWNSTGLGTLGRIIVFRDRFREKYPRIVADSHVTVIRPLQSHMESDFIFALLAGAMVQSEIENMSSGSTKQMELATSTVKSHLIPLPPLAEQKRIVKKVDELMAWCDELETLLQTESETAARFAAAIAQQGGG